MYIYTTGRNPTVYTHFGLGYKSCCPVGDKTILVGNQIELVPLNSHGNDLPVVRPCDGYAKWILIRQMHGHRTLGIKYEYVQSTGV